MNEIELRFDPNWEDGIILFEFEENIKENIYDLTD